MKQKTPRSKKGSKDTSGTPSSTQRSQSKTEVLSPEVLPALDSDQDSEKSHKHEKSLKTSETIEELEEIDEQGEDPTREDLEEPSESDLEATDVPKSQSID
ncbi:hypothetical protein EBS43_01415, partial [bacterium]|nr:hypothetical protein [bacterium]